MILHIGKGETVREKGIIGIFDLDNVTTRAAGREFIARKTREKAVLYAAADIPRSFILYAEPGEEKAKIILSQLSSTALCHRATAGPMSEEEE